MQQTEAIGTAAEVSPNPVIGWDCNKLAEAFVAVSKSRHLLYGEEWTHPHAPRLAARSAEVRPAVNFG